MQLGVDAIKRLITTIGFVPQNGKSGTYCKNYPAHSGYTILVDFNDEKIIYDSREYPHGSAITVWDKTTSNFSQAENFVVLECVDRLLTKGYPPTCIELEKTYPSGRGHSGRLDIFVKTADGAPFLMVECKTWGDEYEKEKGKMAKNGGQLFSYYSNDRDTQYLCLYTSRVEKNVEYNHVIVDVEDAWRSLSGIKEIYDHWNKNFKDNGIFDSYAAPYDVKHKALTYGGLKTLKEEDSGRIYNQIMEILRHNAISDKPNAFNKLLNLFVCKIIDEDKNPDDELEFQWLETDTDESLQLRLNDLYKEGMWRFLEIDVIDYKQDDVIQRLESLDADTKQWVMEMYTNTRLKKSPNFAFVEVQDERTFTLNAKVVREIVELLQVYKFRYAQKHEFLGNFFELLLNTSMKQEAGQYFTPVPITRFILSSLPLQKLVQDRVDTRQGEPLPTVIDYACGSGHFLTEYMSQMQAIIDSGAIDTHKASPNIRRQFQAWQGLVKFLWAKDTVYGIDLDNRLVKTTKVSAFFNGDGDANIVWANGLDHFTKSKTYRGKLNRASGQDNGQFDILISNPPYSVESFKSTVAFGEESFELYPSLTDNSSEIECLFVERMKQLVKVGGWAAVILPSSILTNSGIHAKAREILLKYFNFKAIVELGSGTFMKTGTNTVILFLERRNDNDHKVVMREIDRFFATKTDVAVVGIENAFSTYVASVYEGLPFGDYISLFSGEPTETAREHELYTDYLKAFGDNFLEKAVVTEKEKILYFLLTYNQNIVLVKTGKGKQEKQFLGYEFSERRGHEGLHWLSGGTKLYDEENLMNPQKANSYIYRAFLGEPADIDESMEHNVFYNRLSGFIEYGTDKFDKTLNLGKRKKKLVTIYSQRALGELCDIKIGGTPSRAVSEYFTGENLWVSVSELNGNLIYDTKEKITDDAVRQSNVKLIPAGTTLLGFKLSIGKVAIAGTDLYTNEAIAALIPKDHEVILDKYLFTLFERGVIDLESIKGDNVFGKSLNSTHIKQVKIPLPPLDIQRKIVGEVEIVEHNEEACRKDLERLKKLLQKQEYFQYAERRVGDISVMVKRGKSAKYGNASIQIIKSGQARGYLEFDFTERYYVSQEFVLDERKLEKGDILINSTGVGTAGRVTLFNLDGDFVVDSHITIIRLDRTQAIPKYVLYALANIGFEQIESMADGQSGQIELQLGTILGIKIPLPPFDVQQRIVDKIEQHEAEINRLKEHLDALKEAKDAILQKYL